MIEMMVRRLTISEARKDFADTLHRAFYGREVTIVTKRGKDIAAVVPMDRVVFEGPSLLKKAPRRAK
jgi:prevent-host-death family protein